MGRHTPGAVPEDEPFALVATASHGIRVTAVNRRAAAEGVRVAAALADARAALPALLSRPAEPHRDRTALIRLARWCGRYGPARNSDGTDGLWIDVTGVAHLYGGEDKLIADLCRRLASLALTARAGLADTLGAAHALARFGFLEPRDEGAGGCPPGQVVERHPYSRSDRAWIIAPAGETRAALARLPVEALRLAPETVVLLKRLGLFRIGQLYGLPRAALERRFRPQAASRSRARESADLAAAVLGRLDEALGVRFAPRRPLREPPILSVRRRWAEPLISSQALEAATAALAAELCRSLADAALGARRIRLSLYRADGTVAEAQAGTSSPCRIPAHLLRLLKEKLALIDAGFGIDVAVLEALSVERLGPRQAALGAHLEAADGNETTALIDRLANRLGPARVYDLSPRESHTPERAEIRLPALWGARAHTPQARRPSSRRSPRRPPFLLERPEPIAVVAEVPEGPPQHFTWRRLPHRVVRAEGPERIAPEWWRALGQSRPRDYYRLEDEGGAGYWVFREGLYQNAAEDGPPRWFLHGLFG